MRPYSVDGKFNCRMGSSKCGIRWDGAFTLNLDFCKRSIVKEKCEIYFFYFSSASFSLRLSTFSVAFPNFRANHLFLAICSRTHATSPISMRRSRLRLSSARSGHAASANSKNTALHARSRAPMERRANCHLK